jgi:hypothetical protein
MYFISHFPTSAASCGTESYSKKSVKSSRKSIENSYCSSSNDPVDENSISKANLSELFNHMLDDRNEVCITENDRLKMQSITQRLLELVLQSAYHSIILWTKPHPLERQLVSEMLQITCLESFQQLSHILLSHQFIASITPQYIASYYETLVAMTLKYLSQQIDLYNPTVSILQKNIQNILWSIYRNFCLHFTQSEVDESLNKIFIKSINDKSEISQLLSKQFLIMLMKKAAVKWNKNVENEKSTFLLYAWCLSGLVCDRCFCLL